MFPVHNDVLILVHKILLEARSMVSHQENSLFLLRPICRILLLVPHVDLACVLCRVVLVPTLKGYALFDIMVRIPQNNAIITCLPSEILMLLADQKKKS